MLTNEDKYRVTLNAIVEMLGTKADRNFAEKYALKRAQDILAECNPNTPFWWMDLDVVKAFGQEFTDVFRSKEQ